ncbi:zinc-dependent alcohol dehydrogenase family protein [Streptomyces sp. NPDC047315]|uniref:zinc-dependent alcohol dehydrogenase family protein n=1 Tax=Streptomyces sp. NPDC047315 TaxID=3155142 RepID=UPI0033D4F99D
MRAIVFEEFGGPLAVRDVADPVPDRGGAVVRVEATGLCRSDWHGWRGHDPSIALPHVPGHELAGTVEAVGADVTRIRPGQRVTTPFVCACGRCPACARGAQQVCERQEQPGFTHWGSFAQYVALRHADVNLVPLPDDVTATTAASLGCRFATAFRAVVDQGGVRPGEWTAVYGCGGVGLSAVMVAAAAGARVIAVDVAPGALELARRFGAEVCVDASAAGPDVAASVREASGGGVDLSLDALGSPETCTRSVASLRAHGRHVQIGLLPDGVRLPMDRVIALELSILGSHGMPAHAYPALMSLVASGGLRPDLLITRRLSLAEAPAALAGLDGPGVPGVTVIGPYDD